MGNALVDAGYETSLVGLWELGSRTPADYGFKQHISRAELAKERERHVGQVNFKNGFFGESDPAPLEYNNTHITARRATEELRRLSETGRPWYLHIDCPSLTSCRVRRRVRYNVRPGRSAGVEGL